MTFPLKLAQGPKCQKEEAQLDRYCERYEIPASVGGWQVANKTAALGEGIKTRGGRRAILRKGNLRRGT